ncbi:hypothetical protein ACUY3L_01200 [Corynebacterium mastitidis]
MKKDTHRVDILELNDHEIDQRPVWKDAAPVQQSRWVSLDPDDVSGDIQPGWWEKSHVEEPPRRLRASDGQEGRAHPGLRGLEVVMCTLGVASMALLPVVLNAYLGGWRVPPQVFSGAGFLMAVMAVVVACVSGRGPWRCVGGVFVAVMVCVAVLCVGLFVAQMLGLTR